MAAVRMAEGASPGSHAEALGRLAELRLRQGRLEEAEGLLPGHGGRLAARTAARVRLARGEPAVAVGLLERCLEDGGEPHSHGENHLRVASAMETLVVAYLALGHPAAATGTAARLAELAGGDGGGQVEALAETAAASVAGAGGRPEEARRRLERALELYTGSTSRTRRRRSASSWPASWPGPIRRWPSPRPRALGVFERLGRPATRTPATPCSVRSGPSGGPVPSGWAC